MSAHSSPPTRFGDHGADSSAITLSGWLINHGPDPHSALSALVTRYNDLISQHNLLVAERTKAERAVERLTTENQALWKSLKMPSRSQQQHTTPQQSSMAPSFTPSRSPALLGGESVTASILDASTLRRALSTDTGVQSLRLDSGEGSPVSTASHQPLPDRDVEAHVTRTMSATPPPQLSPRRHSSTSAAARKTSSLDLGRGGPRSERENGSPFQSDASPASLRTPPVPTRGTPPPHTVAARDKLASPRMSVSTSTPSIAEPQASGSRTPERRLLPSITPVSPFYPHGQGPSSRIAELNRSSDVSDSDHDYQFQPRHQLLPPSHIEPSQRERDRTISSNSAVSSLGSGGDERHFSTSSSPLTPARTSSSNPPPLSSPFVPREERRPSQQAATAPDLHSDSASRAANTGHTQHSTSRRSFDQASHPQPLPPALPPRPSSPIQRSASPPRPTLAPAFLPFTTVRVGSSSIKTNERGKEVVTFVIDVTVTIPAEVDPAGKGGTAGWRIEKTHGDVTNLDSAVRAKSSRQEGKSIGSLPDKSLFKDHSPHKSDQRKAVLEKYLQTLISIPLRDRSAVCTFFNTNVSLNSSQLPQSGQMSGWLTKRGRNFGGWQTRYYVLSPGQALAYYDTVNGTKLGEIPLVNAAIGRQSSRTNDSSEDAYLHAFLIRTTNEKEQDADHILCAENDEMRDTWVQALTTLAPSKGTAGQTGPQPQSDSGQNGLAISATDPDGRPAQAARRQSNPGTTLHAQQSATDRRLPVQRAAGSDLAPSASMPADLEAMTRGSTSVSHEPIKRSNSAQGDHAELRSPLKAPSGTDPRRPSVQTERAGSPDHERATRNETSSTSSKIVASNVSGPMNAQPLPSGYDFKKVDRSKKTKSSFWNFGARGGDKTATNNGLPSPAAPARPVFGVPLKEAVAISRIRPGLELPAVVFRCVEYLEAKNAECEEGIFRLSGSANVIRVLKDRFNADGDLNLLTSNEYYDPHAIAGLLKSFLRELPSHLLTRELRPEFLQVIDLRDRKDRVNALGQLVARLPIEEYTLMRFFFAHLCIIAQNAETSKMNLRNLGIVFSPTLGIPAPLFTLLLAEFDLVFAVEQETGLSRPIMVQDESETEAAAQARKRANRNSELYSASGAALLMESEATRRSLREQEEGYESEESHAGRDEQDLTQSSMHLR